MNSLLKYARKLPLTVTRTSNLNYVERCLALPFGNISGIKIAASYLEQYSLANKMPATILQVGAFDGVTNDPIHHVLARGNVHGVLLEPLQHSFQKLKNTYDNVDTVECLQKALGNEVTQTNLYFPASESQGSQVASFSREHVVKHVRSMNYACQEVEHVTIDVIDIAALLLETGSKNFDLIQIDAEGYDDVIVKLILKSQLDPFFMGFETSHLDTQSLHQLFGNFKALGYEWIQSIDDVLVITKRGQALMDGKF